MKIIPAHPGYTAALVVRAEDDTPTIVRRWRVIGWGVSEYGELDPFGVDVFDGTLVNVADEECGMFVYEDNETVLVAPPGHDIVLVDGEVIVSPLVTYHDGMN